MTQNSSVYANATEKEPIAIIGIGCRFPGGANSPEAFWKMLRDGVDAITEVPEDRWNVDAFYDPDGTKPGKMRTRWGGFIEKIDEFDAEFFGISPREASRMDPQQRLLLEIAWEALEDGGQVPENLAGSKTGVFIGIFGSDYYNIQLGECDSINAYTNLGGHYSIAANRISYLFDLKGPSMAVDTACSSSLVAVDLACQSIWNGKSAQAIAGGANALLKPEMTIGFSKASMLSPDGRCFAFDERGNGYVRAEGAGVVVLKPLSQAQADADPIYAVIRGSAVNQDGQTNGITVPNGEAQEAVIRQACKQAGISPGQIQYIEAHGTGTPVGDPIETNALGNAIGKNRPTGEYCTIGSVKTNIGHLEAGSGIAGLIKLALALKHRQIPPSLHFQTPNPKIPFEELRLRVPTALEPWPKVLGPRLAGINSFGFGGTNAHAVLAEAPEKTAGKGEKSQIHNPKTFLLPLSARSAEALQALAGAYKDFLTTEDASLSDICYSASLRRGHHDYRLTVAADSKEELTENLSAFLGGETRIGMSEGRLVSDKSPKLAFVFSGMGQQWWAMGRTLLAEEPVFREIIQRCDFLLRQYTNWSLLEELTASEENSRINSTQIAQCAIFSLQVALAALWRSWGIIPNAIVGHSVGEVAAAHVAGVLSLEDAVRVIFHRSRLQATMAGTGKMLAVGLSLESVERLLEGYEELVSVAAVNSPSSVTLSGDSSVLETIAQSLETKQIFCRFLQVEVPYHSPLMESLKAELAESLQGINPQKATINLFSTVTGQQVAGPEIDGDYWTKNMRNSVLFVTAVEELLQVGCNFFVEIGAHPVLASYISECSAKAGKKATVLPSLRRKEPEEIVMLGAFGKLYTVGYPVDWHRLYPEGEFVRLPSYPWQQERYWNETEESQQQRLGKTYLRLVLGTPVHPLLGSRLEAPQPLWKAVIDKSRLTYLDHHRIQGAVVYPGAAYVEMVLAAAKEIFGAGQHIVENIELHKALFLADEPTMLQLSIERGSQTAFEIHSQVKGEKASWVRHASGNLLLNQNGYIPQPVLLDEVRSRCTNEMSKSALYQKFQEIGLEYGPNFQGIEQLWHTQSEALALLKLPEGLEKDIKDYLLHPALLDASFQVLIGTVSSKRTYLPIQIKQLRVYSLPGLQVWSHARLVEQNERFLKGDMQLLDEAGNVLVEMQGCCAQSLGKAQSGVGKEDDYLYEYRWELKARPDRALVRSSEGSWLIFADRSGVGQQLAVALKEHSQTPILIQPGDTFGRLDADSFQIRPESPEDMQQLIETVSASLPACRGIIHLWSLDIATVEETTVASLEQALPIGCLSVLHLVQALQGVGSSPRFVLVTKGAQAITISDQSVQVAQAPLWALGRVINNELPNLQCTKVDITSAEEPAEIQALFVHLWSDEGEDEIALRGEARYVNRLVRVSMAEIAAAKKKAVTIASQPFRLEISQPGILDNLTLRAITRSQPGPGEVEIQVSATGLNFKDVAKVMNLLAEANLEGTFSGRSLGLECAGIITAIGSGVEGFNIGDEVIACAAHSFSSHVTTDARLVVRKPAHISFEEAATIPVVFLTAYYALHELGRISKGDRVLIHAAAGGVGLAAIQLAQKAGAEIFATAGSPEKREFLLKEGVHHVMDSRSLAFADEVMRLTGGKGVDIVLNSLAGEAIPKSLSVLAPYGRFIEIGKRDIDANSKLGLRPFQNNLALFSVDLDRLWLERPDRARGLFLEVMKHFEAQTLHPLPHRVFPISQVRDAFRYMARALHIGKIVVSLQDPDVVVVPAIGEKVTFRPDATYLITGGLSGFGLAAAQWLVKNGAKYLVLMGRTGEASLAAKEAVKSLSEAGASVRVAKADVSQATQVADVFADIEQSMPPLRGIIHAAGIYDDDLMLEQNRERFFKVMAPKIAGAWNLHAQTVNTPLDLFVNFSSVASIIGTQGQGNYAAANAFLDALAHYRRQKGLAALSVNWGPIVDVGVTVRRMDEVEKLFHRVGVSMLPSQHALDLLGKLLLVEAVQTIVVSVNWQRWYQVYVGRVLGRFSYIIGEDTISEQSGERSNTEEALRQAIMAAAPAERLHLLEERLREPVARILGTSAAKLDSSKSLIALGLDSLMAVELSNKLNKLQIGDTVSPMQLLEGMNLTQLATILLTAMGGATETISDAITPVDTETLEQALAELEQLSEEEVQAMLAAE